MSSQSSNCSSYRNFESRVRGSSSSLEFRKKFDDSSRKNNRRAMIDHILTALGPAPIAVEMEFDGKDVESAERLMQQADELTREHNDKLTGAVAAALPDSELFFKCLMRRARQAYATGRFQSCARDCRLYLDRRASITRGDESDDAVDVLFLLSDACKGMRKDVEARNHVNEAMKLISRFAATSCGTDRADSQRFKDEKAELFKRFLSRRQKPTVASSTRLKNSQEDKEVPAVLGKNHEYLSCASDAVDLVYDPSKGRCLYARRNIPAGSVVIVDRPFAWCTDTAALARNCLHCHASLRLDHSAPVPCRNCRSVLFCSENCRAVSWNKYHRFECRIFNYFHINKLQRTSSLLAYRTVITAALSGINGDADLSSTRGINRDFLKLHEDEDATPIDAVAPDPEKYKPDDYKTVFALKTHGGDFTPEDNFERAVQSIFLARCFIDALSLSAEETEKSSTDKDLLRTLAVAMLHSMHAINCNAYEIVENVRDESSKIFEPRNVGGAIYSTVSLTNHSCYPNVVRHSYPCGAVVVRSIRFIPQGAEVLDCYGQHFLESDRDTRRKFTAAKYHFDCQCDACVNDWPMQLPTDKFDFKCKKCFGKCRKTTRSYAECTSCGQKTDINKYYIMLQNSVKKRLSALTKMYDGNYSEALPLLLEHSDCIDKILSEPSLETVKTQQSIIQCLNALSSTSV
ncbi:SET and MYND domain-containing protein 4-like [Trichogramma pretiosum]|uniref:SET and MYND domain-containing protein 4-like n=1 Tax=Trichogramma pretiosum TaxID=7493 RepID=UPI000C71B7F8|nr:SET and MYND domain-containing protein 4-like [Trichogramma pretiosum]